GIRYRNVTGVQTCALPISARCLGSLERTASSVLRKSWWFDVLFAAIQSSVVPGSRRSPGKREGRKRGPRNRGGAAVTERTSAQRSEERRVGKGGEAGCATE